MDLTPHVLGLVAILAAATVFCWLAYAEVLKKRAETEERRLMIEKGMTPPFKPVGSWPAVKQHEQQLKYEERRLMIEKGLTPPENPTPPRTATDYLRRGLFQLALGIGMAIAFAALRTIGYTVHGDAEDWLFGLIVASPVLALCGVANLVNYRVLRDKRVDVAT
ncbi:MAG TPA: hypothetical protein VFI56_13640 [Vicinamibacterales bacterium]|nr:hypothetical protein [Vicinamibacterales bacterium]